ncbi:MAG: hypothetical protein AAFP77_13990 [Bacteroidota bacterium]
MKHTSVLHYACLAGLYLFLVSCTKETMIQPAEEAAPLSINQPITAADIDPSWVGRTLTFEEAQSLGMASDRETYEELPVYLEEAPSPTQGGHDLTCVGGVGPTACCEARALACDVANVDNSAFRPVGCFETDAFAQDLRLTMKIFINGQFSSYLTHYQVQPDPFGCVYYDPFVIRDEDGNITHYRCAVLYDKLGDCPATITIETEWRYSLPESPSYVYCGFTSEDFYYPGFPSICDQE